MLLSRWLGRDIQKYTWFLLLGLIVLVVAQRLIVVLAKVVAGKIPADLVGLTLLYYLPEIIGVLLPVCFGLAVILVSYRLQKNHELEALRSLGFRDGQVMSLLMKQAVGIGVVTIFLVTLVSPWSFAEQERLKSEMGLKLWQQYFEPGLFQAVKASDFKGMIHVTEDNGTTKLFTAKVIDGLTDVVIADKPELATDDRQLYLDTQEGTLYRFSPEGTQKIGFENAKLRLNTQKKASGVDEAAMSMGDLWHSDVPKAKAEFFWRIGIGTAVFMTALLMVPLFRCRPRKGSISTFVICGGATLLFANTLVILQASVRQGFLSWWAALLLIWLVFGSFAVWRIFQSRRLVS